MRQPVKSIFAYLMFGVVACVILPLIFIEFLMIVLDPIVFRDYYQYDTNLGSRVRSYYSVDGNLTNRFGFNDRDYTLKKAPGTFRIVVIGDSFGWAGGRNGNYTALLEQKFEARDSSHKIDVINAGYPGTHTGEQLAMLKKYGLQYDPDLVVLGFFAGNDFIDADPNRKRIVVNGVSMDIKRSEEHTFLGYPVIKQSRLLLFVKQKSKILWEQRKAGTKGQNIPGQQPMLSEESFLNLERAWLEFFSRDAVHRRRFQPNTDYILQSVSEMDALLHARDIKFMVAIYPDEFQVNDSLRETLFAKFQLRPKDYDIDLAQNVLKTFLNSKGISFLDLTDPFRAAAKQQRLYLFRNPHWNRAGNQLAADLLFEDIEKRAASRHPFDQRLIPTPLDTVRYLRQR